MKTDLVEVNEKLPAAITPMGMLQTAVDKGASLEQMQQLMDLQERWEANEARKAYVVAMNDFKANPPTIRKNKHVEYNNYDHATLDHVVRVIGEAMSKHALSFRWDTEQNGSIKVSCIVTHALGHSERVSLQAEADNSGKKNSIQAIASTVTYLERYTLLAVTGLAAQGIDDDGQGSEPAAFISEAQVTELVALLDEYGVDEARWLKHCKIGTVGSVLTTDFDAAVANIKRHKK